MPFMTESIASSDQEFTILGLCNGSIRGNSEILLKAALQAALSSTPATVKTSWIHVPSVMIPRNPKPLKSAADISLGNVATMRTGVSTQDNSADDRLTILDAILDADALIFATPIYSHQPPGFLKAVIDRILGPFTDAAFVQRALERKAAGDPKFKDQPVDARVLKPRVVGFLAVGGSPRNEHITMALPTLHQFVYPIHAKVVDQVVLNGFASPGSVIFREEGRAVERAELLGRNVASQLGKQFDEAAYLGPKPEGSCPFCHLSKIDYFGGPSSKIGCIVCGAKGKLVVEDNKIKPEWSHESVWSCITMEGKTFHIEHVQEAGAEEAQALASYPPSEFETIKRRLLDVDVPALPLPSVQAQKKNATAPADGKGFLSFLSAYKGLGGAW